MLISILISQKKLKETNDVYEMARIWGSSISCGVMEFLIYFMIFMRLSGG